MCATSVVLDYGKRIWNDPDPFIIYPEYKRHTLPLTPEDEKAKLDKFFELIKKAEEFDKAAKQPDCVDPEKAKLIEALKLRLDRLESQLKVLKAKENKKKTKKTKK